jgi:hypothetical protein
VLLTGDAHGGDRMDGDDEDYAEKDRFWH